MASSAPRQRHPASSSAGLLDPGPSSPSSRLHYSKEYKPSLASSVAGGFGDRMPWLAAFLVLLSLRLMSATSNIVHDCDEVFNYWEPLHFLTYKSGFQTWEYSSEFALRSYLYLLIHALVTVPASLIFGENKIRVFYAVRFFLGATSAITETVLVIALARRYGRRLAWYAVAVLCLTSGSFFASTSFLPSSFSMYTVTLSSALFLFEKYAMAVSVAAAGVIIGWPFAILVVLPVTIYSLIKGPFKKVFLSGLLTSLCLLVISAVADHHFYGKWTYSVFNLLKYNVLGGGESHLYGTEGLSFYFRNGFNNFNFCFVLALLFPVTLLITKKRYVPDLLIVVSPIYIWLAFMTLQAHKEERFLYPIYPLICVAATAVIDSFPDIFHEKYAMEQSIFYKAAKVCRPIFLALILATSHSRTFSILNGYSAPLQIYKHLEYYEDVGNVDSGSVLCVGSEWHRYPSSFFVPSHVSEVRWIDDGFRGLLPMPFNTTLGGTASAPPYFNNKNKAAANQYLTDIEACTFFVELDLRRPYPSRGSDLSTWEVLAAVPFLDRELSPALYRSFFIPYKWQEHNVFGLYKLLKRLPVE